MNVDLDAIAHRGRCEVSSLRLALPLIEQGYTPPFLARYRRDELGNLDESSLWALSHAIRSQQKLDEYRNELHAAWQATTLADPAIGRAIASSKSRRLLDRLSRRLKSEAGESKSLTNRLTVRLLNPIKGDNADLETLAASLIQDSKSAQEPAADDASSPDASADAAAEASAAIARIDETLAKRLSGDPRIIGAAVRWLSRNAKIHILEVSDPHGGDDDSEEAKVETKESERAQPVAASQAAPPAAESPADVAATNEASAEETSGDASPADSSTAEASPSAESASEAVVAAAENASETSSEPEPTASEAETTEAAATSEVKEAEEKPPAPEAESSPTEQPAAETTGSEVPDTPKDPAVAETAEQSPEESGKAPKSAKKKQKNVAQAPKKKKKVSPRQRRRRWLVSTLKPLAGKRLPASKLSAFQIVMLGRALRSQVAQCAFDYDAAKLVAELQKTASHINQPIGDLLAQVVMDNEAAIRDAAEGAWWDEIQEQASARLVSIAADNLHRQINRGGVDAKVVMSIDAIGPRTAATSIIAADGRMLHNEDIPCQLSAAMRTLAVTKMGELIHRYHVDLIVISNGPARRACMVAVGELIKQSADKSIRWTLADRSGADAYAGSPAGDQEMRSTPRRFRSAAWIAFSTLQPSQAMVKVDPLKLRLGSFQRELSDQAVLEALEDVLISGAARGGVDVNSTTTSWLERLPGMTRNVAETIDTQRREKLISSRNDLLARGDWSSPIQSRQALPFLRVFASDEVLDGTLIHPDDYALAKKLAKALEIEMPPECPPGYQLPDYSEKTPETPVSTETPPPASSQESSGDEPAFGADAELSPSESTDSADASATASSESADAPSHPETSETPAESDTEPTAAAEQDSAEPNSGSEAAEAESDASESTATEQAPAAATAEEASVTVPEPIRRPKPDRAKVDKLIKEWQVGVRRSQQIVNWLCEPFGEGASGGPTPAVMTSMPTLSELKQGDPVIGVVVGVMPFGVFVELSPECSGLIHVSRISDGFVEDLHEAVQVGDVVTAWVTGIDTKRRRVGLSAISPQREAELQSQRHEARGGGRGGYQGGQRGSSQSGDAGSSQAGQAGSRPKQRGGQGGPGKSGGRDAGSQGGRSRSESGSGRNTGSQRGRSRDGGRRDSRGGGSRGPRKPEVYEVVGKEPESAPLSDAMQKGKEPLRSFGDLMQLFSKEKEQPAAKPKQPSKSPAEAKAKEDASNSSVTEPAEPSSAPPESDNANSAANEKPSDVTATPENVSSPTEPANEPNEESSRAESPS